MVLMALHHPNSFSKSLPKHCNVESHRREKIKSKKQPLSQIIYQNRLIISTSAYVSRKQEIRKSRETFSKSKIQLGLEKKKVGGGRLQLR